MNHKKTVFYLISVTVIWLAGGLSCNNMEMPDKEMALENEQGPLYSPLENEKNNIGLLVGDWDVIKLAYTADGENITNEAAVTDCAVAIYNKTLAGNELPEYEIFVNIKFDYLAYLITGNRMKLIMEKSVSYPVLVTWTDDETEVLDALCNAHSFDTKDDELLIYFTGKTDKNLLILKKR